MQKKLKEDKNCKCPHCGANMYIHGHRLSKGLVNSLILFRKSILERNRNFIHIKDEMSLTKSQFTNFQKLRYHGLVAKYIDPETKEHVAGYWVLTRRGNQFCKNILSLPVVVYTFRNKIVNKHTDRVFLSDVLKNDELPYWDEKPDFICKFEDITEIEEIDFDINGQGLLFK